MKNESRIYYWDNLKAILIILVILGHCLEMFNDNFIVYKVWTIICTFHMPLFVLMSGVFLTSSPEKRKKRIINMALLYIFVQSFYAFGQIVKTGDLVFNLNILYPSFGAWYLLFLVYVFVIIDFFRKDKKINTVLILVGLSLLIGFDDSLSWRLAIGRTFYFLPIFMVGYFYKGDLIKKFVDNNKKVILFLSIVATLIILLLASKTLFPPQMLTGSASYVELHNGIRYYGLLSRALGYILVFIMSAAVLIFIPDKKTFLSSLGTKTLTMYLAHILLWPISVHFLKNLSIVPNLVMNELILISLLFLINLLFSLFIVLIWPKVTYYFNKLRKRMVATT